MLRGTLPPFSPTNIFEFHRVWIAYNASIVGSKSIGKPSWIIYWKYVYAIGIAVCDNWPLNRFAKYLKPPSTAFRHLCCIDLWAFHFNADLPRPSILIKFCFRLCAQESGLRSKDINQVHGSILTLGELSKAAQPHKIDQPTAAELLEKVSLTISAYPLRASWVVHCKFWN